MSQGNFLQDSKFSVMCRQDLRYCNRTQVQLPTPWKTSTGEAGADIKQSGFIQGPVTWKMGDSYLKAHLIISAILTSLYRGTMGRGEVRNFWLRAVSEFCSLVVSVCPECTITQIHCSICSFTANIWEQDLQAVFLMVLRRRCFHNSCGQGLSLWSGSCLGESGAATADVYKILIRKLLIHES